MTPHRPLEGLCQRSLPGEAKMHVYPLTLRGWQCYAPSHRHQALVIAAAMLLHLGLPAPASGRRWASRPGSAQRRKPLAVRANIKVELPTRPEGPGSERVRAKAGSTPGSSGSAGPCRPRPKRGKCGCRLEGLSWRLLSSRGSVTEDAVWRRHRDRAGSGQGTVAFVQLQEG